MKITRGEYNIKERHLRYTVAGDILFNNKPMLLSIKGENGIGKTTFLEEIMLPHLKSQDIKYLYIGQDIRTQLYTLRSMLAVSGHRVGGYSEEKILKLWVRKNRHASVFILDEFDKYFPNYHFLFEWSRSFIQTYVIVSHTEDRDITPGDGFGKQIIRFTPMEWVDGVKQVQISSASNGPF